VKQLKEHVRSLFDLNDEETNIFLSKFSRTSLSKNDVFITPAKVCHTIGLIETGLMKCVYHQNGEEIVFEFAYENSFISDYYSYVTLTPSEKEIRCLEDTVVHTISRENLERLGKEHAFVESMSRKINEGLFLQMHDRLKSMLLDPAAERYQKLVAERQDLTQRIPQYLLASYLNVKPETISRIRKKMSNR
jgi:CRP-like cAMP-binding protein